MKKGIFLALFVCVNLLINSEEILLWHSFEGFVEEKFCAVIDGFNQQSETFKVVPIRKGNYTEVYKKGIAAFEKGEAPHLLQVYEVANFSMMEKTDYFVSVDALMRRYHHHFDPDVYIDVVRRFYSDDSGKMLSFPWNASTGILYYNKKAFEKAGLDPERPPKTWVELEAMSVKLIEAGYKGFTTAWPAAYHLEHFSCWHNLPFATELNGFKSQNARLCFDQKPQIEHFEKLVEWQDRGVFSYSGRFTTQPEEKFANQECAILLQGANRLPLLQGKSDFEIGVGSMPYWPHLIESPQNMNIGGASFWVMEGFSDDEYRAIVQFFDYLSSTVVQSDWHQITGYLPITDAAYHLTKKKGFYSHHPAHETAVLEVLGNKPTPYSFGVRIKNYIEVREVIIDFLEKALNKELSPEEAMHQAVLEGNQLVDTFEN